MHWTPTPIAAAAVAATVAVAPVAVAQSPADAVHYTLTVSQPAGPLEGVPVTLTGADVEVEAVTDYTGAASFDVPPGTYTYEVAVQGMEPFTDTIELAEDRDTALRVPGPERTVDFTWPSLITAAGSRATIEPEIDGDAQGVTVEQMTGPAWVDVFDDGTVEAMPPATTEPGSYDVDVRTSAGQVSTLRLQVTGAADPKALKYPVTSVQVGKRATSATPTATLWRQGRAFAGQPVPGEMTFSTSADNATVDATTGRVTLDAEGLEAKAGDTVEVPVEGTMPNGARVRTSAVFHLTAQPSAERYSPSWEPVEVAPGERAEVPQTGETDMPEDAEYWWLRLDNPELAGWRISVDQHTGTLSVTPDEAAQPYDLKVRVSYADGSQSRVSVPLALGEPTAQAGDTPTHTPQLLHPGKATEILDAERAEVEVIDDGGVDITVDKATGKVTATVPQDAMRGAKYEVNLRVGGKERTLNLTADAAELPPAPSQQPTRDTDGESSVRDAWWIPVVMVVMAALGAGAHRAYTEFNARFGGEK